MAWAGHRERMRRHGIETGLTSNRSRSPSCSSTSASPGPYFYGIARGIDERQVRPNRIRKSVGAEDTFAEDIEDLDEAKAELRPLAEKVWRYCERTTSLEDRNRQNQIFELQSGDTQQDRGGVSLWHRDDYGDS